jgi:hypothetical protein
MDMTSNEFMKYLSKAIYSKCISRHSFLEHVTKFSSADAYDITATCDWKGVMDGRTVVRGVKVM